MSRTWKIILIVLAFNTVCVLVACAVLLFWFPVFRVVTDFAGREPTREEWAQSPKGDGTYLIGDKLEMSTGIWHTASDKYGCKWRICSTRKCSRFINSGSERTVNVRGYPNYYFKTEGCGTWHLIAD